VREATLPVTVHLDGGTAGTATQTYRSVNPATGALVREYPRLLDTEAEDRLARAHTAFPGWCETAVAERVRLFRRFADLVERDRNTLAHRATLEMGKVLAQSVAEADLVAQIFRYYADNGEELLGDELIEVPGLRQTIIRREPIGVVLGIEPWNAPMYQAMRAAAPNLMLGNTVLVKPAEQCPGTTLLLDELFAQAGFPADVYQTALVSVDQVSAYLADPRVRAVTFTGSDRAGAIVGAQAGTHVKPVVLELGGSDAFIVLDSADVPKAAAVAAACRIYMGGQACVSPKRIILTEAVADAFTAQFAQAFANQKVGDPLDADTTIGPMASVAAADHVQQQLQDALDKGATVIVPGGRMPGPGAYFAPAAITDITPAMRVSSEEVFGPLAVIYRVPDADAAVALANGSPYGLGGTVFGEDVEEARRVARHLDTGGVGINAYLGAPVEIPFGGTKASGTGRELGRSGMDQFANIKTYGIG
jgi:succinate-semialdehyde dehydrogenase / glutarate-semialdehyde dehydrogenase